VSPKRKLSGPDVLPAITQAPPDMPRPLRVVVAAHSHPEVSNGGAEIAAFELFRGLQAEAGCEAWFLGCDRDGEADRPGAILSQPFSDREYLYLPRAFDWFKFANRDSRFPAEIERLFAELAPDVVHFHHYIVFGVEVFQHLRRAVPHCKILLTLHEYLAICHHFGQMVTKPHRNLCYESSPVRCQRCFPEFGRSDFFLRERYIRRFLDLVDGFIAPSHFLAERYVAWGIPAAKMTVLENVSPAAPPATAAPATAAQTIDGPLRIGFFGQISGLKGINVLLDAAEILVEQDCTDVTLEIFGDYRSQPPDFQTEFLDRLKQAGRNVRFHGPYDRQRVDRLMQSVHAVLIPSIWWENSPVVIQEALRNHRPIICSDIGGMAEKVRDGVDGFHFPVGSPVALAALLRRFAADPAPLLRRAAEMQAHPAPESALQAHLRLYRAQGAGG
jgi:glycosyltransferase involved in cell wall biosynthesis